MIQSDIDEESAISREARYRGGYTYVQRDPLLPDVEPEQHPGGIGGGNDDDIEMRLPRGRDRSQSTVSNISEHGKDLAPIEEPPLVVGYNILILLFAVGVLTAFASGFTRWANKMISFEQARVLESNAAGPFLLMLTTTAFCALSAAIVWKGNKVAAIGSGMPEVKSVLGSDLHRSDFKTIVSFKIACIRLSSLICAMGSGLSIGTAAPLMHVAVCISYVLMNIIPDYGEFLENHAVRKQIFTAAAAVGMSTVFNAPIGGLLLSLELTSTFYLMSNYWRSFMVATTGAVVYSIFLLARNKNDEIYAVPIVSNPFAHWEFIMFALMGGIGGGLGLCFLKLHQTFFLLVKPYTHKYPVSTAAAAGTLTALLIYAAGAHSAQGVSESIILHDVYLDSHISQMDSRTAVSPLGGLIGSFVVRVFLTLLGTTMRISCGVFLPTLTIGALGGRIFGQILAYICGNASSIYVAGYAMVGAATFASATTHSISVAVIVIEQTGQFSMLLPCLLGAVIACGISKSRSLSLFDQGMVNKGLESFELLLKESTGHRYAADVLDEKVISVHEQCTVQDLFTLLGNLRQTTFPVTSNSGRLVGSLERFDVFTFLKSVFEKENLYGYMRKHVPADAHVEDRRLERLHLIETRNALLRGQGIIHNKGQGGQHHQEYDEDGHPVSRIRGVFGILSRSVPGHHYSADQYAQDESFHSERSEGGTGFGEGGSVPTDDGNHRGPTAINPLHQESRPLPPLPSSPGRAVNKTPFPPGSPDSGHGHHSEGNSWHSASPLDSLDNMVKRFSNRISGFGMSTSSSHTDQHSNDKKDIVMDAITQLRLDNLLAQSVDLAQEPLLPINGFPFTAHRHTTMDELYVLFEMVKVQCVFVVTNSKRLEGMISKNLLMQTLKKKTK